MTKTLTKNFDYSELPADTKGKLLKLAGYFKKAREKQALSIVEAGEFIANAHEELASAGREGKFSAWVEGECVCSRSAAYRYMGVFREFGNCPNVGQFDDSALYLLSADVAPKSAKKEALKLAAKGEYIAHKRAKELIEKHTVTVAPSANGQTDDPVTSNNGAAQAPSSTPQPEPASADLTDDEHVEPCPNCKHDTWIEDTDGWCGEKCKHPLGEPAGDPDKHTPKKPTVTVDIDALAAPYKEHVNAINKAKRELKALAENQKPGGHLNLVIARVLKACDDAKTPLAQCTPTEECGKCSGKGCKACLQTGFLTKAIVEARDK